MYWSFLIKIFWSRHLYLLLSYYHFTITFHYFLLIFNDLNIYKRCSKWTQYLYPVPGYYLGCYSTYTLCFLFHSHFMNYIGIKIGNAPTKFQSTSLGKFFSCTIYRRTGMYLIKSNQFLVTLTYSHRNHQQPLQSESASDIHIFITGSVGFFINMIINNMKLKTHILKLKLSKEKIVQNQ